MSSRSSPKIVTVATARKTGIPIALGQQGNRPARRRTRHDIIPGKSAESRMIQLVGGLEPDLIMPQKARPADRGANRFLRAWIDQGAPGRKAPRSKPQPAQSLGFQDADAAAVPSVKNKKWPRNPIDDFVLARLEAEKLALRRRRTGAP
jgi:hypothetical protein